jgi:hypothetical protein
MLNPGRMYLHSTRSGTIDSDALRGERRFPRVATAPLNDEPYVEVDLEMIVEDFTPEEQAFFAEGDEMERQLEEELD